jgi:hypothetical protein
MTRYAKLGILSIRWMAVGLFVLTAVWILILSIGGWAMGSMMGQQGNTAGFGRMMGGGLGILWGPALLNLLVGALLYALSGPIGTMMSSGLADGSD